MGNINILVIFDQNSQGYLNQILSNYMSNNVSRRDEHAETIFNYVEI